MRQFTIFNRKKSIFHVSASGPDEKLCGPDVAHGPDVARGPLVEHRFSSPRIRL